MSEDKIVCDMVNEHAARVQGEGRKDTPSVTAQGRASSPKGGAKGGEAAGWFEAPLNADYIRAGQLLGDEHVAKEKRTVREAGPYNDSNFRAFLLMAIKALLWVLLGLVVLSMALGGYAGIVAVACVCQCIAQAAVRVDRYFRKR